MPEHPQYWHDRARRDEKVAERFAALREEPLVPPLLPPTRVSVPGLQPGGLRALLYRDDGKLYLAEVGRTIGRRFSTRPVLAIHQRQPACEVWTEDRHPEHGGPLLIRCDAVVDSIPFDDEAA